MREVFQVSPGRNAPTVYTVETPVAAGELVPENNARSTLVQPPLENPPCPARRGCARVRAQFSQARVGVRSRHRDRLGRAQGQERTRRRHVLHSGRGVAERQPRCRIPCDARRPVPLRRGGARQRRGTSVHQGPARSDAKLCRRARRRPPRARRAVVPAPGTRGHCLEDVLPLDLNARGSAASDLDASGGDVVPASVARGANRVSLTPAGEAHPVMQLAAGADDTRKRWEAVPALASIAPLGGPRPGASVLAVTNGPGGTPRALVAVQRFGEGRSMVFAGEASWRWRMLAPATDRAYDTFWKQALRWLALPAGDPIQVSVEPGAAPGGHASGPSGRQDAAFEPLKNVTVDVRVTSPDGRVESLRAGPDTARGNDGHYVAHARPEHAGVVKLSVDVRQGTTRVGTASASVLVGGADLEMTDPRVNQAFLERLAARVRRPRAGRGSSAGPGEHPEGWRAGGRAGRPPRPLAHGMVICGDTDAARS